VSGTVKVLQLINGEFYSGAERVQDLLALNLEGLGFEVGFACVKPGRFPSERASKSASLHLVQMRSRFDLRCVKLVAQLVRQNRYQLIHTHSPRAALIGNLAARLVRVPMVHHVHSPTSRDTESALRNNINSFIERMSLIGVSRLIPVSRSLETHLNLQSFEAKKICMVANGVPTPGPLPSRPVPQGEWVIGSVALFRPRKGLETLLQAFAKLRVDKRVRLRAVGPFETPEYEESIHRLANELRVSDAIDWVGFTDDVNGQMAQMDLFVLPSLFGEGMPMVILEAMAMGVPVVASSVEGIPEVIESEESGLIFPPGDSDALASALCSTIENTVLWTRMRERAYQLQVEKYSAKSMAQGVAEVYRGVLAEG
jgi:glycosyltransferase involved in cell wall biosynthesis